VSFFSVAKFRNHTGTEATGEKIVLGRGDLRKGIGIEIITVALVIELGLRLDRPVLKDRDGITELERRG